MKIALQIKPKIKGQKVGGSISNPGITYDQADIVAGSISSGQPVGMLLPITIPYPIPVYSSDTTYNDSRYMYGGEYGAVDGVKPKGRVETSKAFINDPGITYDQINGTISGVSSNMPLGLLLSLTIPSGTQSYSSDAIYNDSRYAYGGVTGSSEGLKPQIASTMDIYTKGFIPVHANTAMGPGFFMFITQ